MGLQADSARLTAPRRGFVLGELLVAVFLLAVAISSVTALMYSVTRPRTRPAIDCTEQAGARSPQCQAPAKAGKTKVSSAAKLLVSGCATRSGARVQACTETGVTAQSSDATTLRSRTDSASLELLPKKARRTPRPDLGFIR